MTEELLEFAITITRTPDVDPEPLCLERSETTGFAGFRAMLPVSRGAGTDQGRVRELLPLRRTIAVISRRDEPGESGPPGITDSLRILKRDLRRRGYAARRSASLDPERSRIACENLIRTPEYQGARTVLWYLNVRTELATQAAVARELESGRLVVVPWVSGGELRLWRLGGFDELETGAFGILEPVSERRTDGTHEVAPRDLDLVVVPGVAFDARGNRIGNGHGYYDRFLTQVSDQAHLIGLCFESQRFERVPGEPHDRAVDKVVTETGIWSGGTLASW